MVVAADTSFLFSLYGNDAHSKLALSWLEAHTAPLRLTALNEFELGNALRFAVYKSFLPRGRAALYWRDFEQDKEEGRLRLEPCNLSEVIQMAQRLSLEWTLSGGHRSFDILHVAAGVVLEATHFLTFDQNQLQLAGKAGLNAPSLHASEHN